MLEDSVFVATMTKSGGNVTVSSGTNTPVTSNVAAGVQIFQVPMGVGTQSFQFATNSGKSGTAISNITVSADCWVSHSIWLSGCADLLDQNGIYNFNYHSGSISP